MDCAGKVGVFGIGTDGKAPGVVGLAALAASAEVDKWAGRVVDIEGDPEMEVGNDESERVGPSLEQVLVLVMLRLLPATELHKIVKRSFVWRPPPSTTIAFHLV